MKEKITIIIADDNIEFTKKISTYIKQKEDETIEVIGIAKDGKEALKMIVEKQPDVVLLDIMMPKLDGIGVLERLNEREKESKEYKKPIVIISSAIGQNKITNQALNLGAEYYIIKPFDLDILVKRIKDIKFFKEKDTKNKFIVKETKEPYISISETKTNYENIEAVVTNLIHEIGIPANIKGYQYIRKGIILSINDMEMVNQITKELYPELAKKFKTTSSRVERAIRHAIEVTWAKAETNKLESIFRKHAKRKTN